MTKRTGLCKYCKSFSWWCDENHACDGNTGFAPFEPIEGLKYSRDEIIAKWYKEVEKACKGAK